MELVAAPPSRIDAMWEKLEPRIAKVLSIFPEEGFSPPDVYRMVKAHEAQAWTSSDDDVVFVTQIQLNNLGQPFLLMWLFQADELLDEHWKLLDQIKAWGKMQGCNLVKVIARPGFEKSLVKHGWKTRHITLMQEI